jgi:hypothetical protein
MRVTIPPVVTVALLVSFTPLRANAQSDADTREVMAYRLTMPKLKQFNQALADYNRQREADPAYKRLQDKKRELARLNEKDELTEAEEERMAQLEAEIAEAEEAEETDDQDASLGEMADRLASDRWMAGALQRAGLAPREAATLQLALLQTMITVSMLDAGTIKEIPKEVNAENVRFYQANAAEIATLTALMNREGQEPN